MKLIDINNIAALPKTEGVYFIFSRTELLYIGRSNNINNRIKHHLYAVEQNQLINPKEILFIGYIEISNHEDTKQTEQLLLSCIATKYNSCWYCNRNLREKKGPTKEDYELIMKVNL